MFGGMQPKLENKVNERFSQNTFTNTTPALFVCFVRMYFQPIIAAAAEIQRNCTAAASYLAIYFNLSVVYLFFWCPSVHPPRCLLSPHLPLPLIPVGQQCSSSVVSIIIIQSVLLSTNCQHSTNACLAINAIFLFSSHNFSNLLSFLIISFPFLFLFFLSIFSPSSIFSSPPSLAPFGCCSFQISVAMARTKGEREKRRGEGRKCA